MPYIVNGEPSSWKDNIYDKDKYDYDYPNNLDLRPNSDFHNELRSKIWERARVSRNEISKRFDSWREIDKTFKQLMLIYLIPKKMKRKKRKFYFQFDTVGKGANFKKDKMLKLANQLQFNNEVLKNNLKNF